ncbi:hypothetical protein VOI32_19870 [Paraburkholderia caribensis]|uniref:Uncharacterized protein n=1 Tax=Paraburkholderia caribensis TaxID=75105 RepID=A0A9Q6S3Y3_9BURK|nr:hypothetical protein [Paraburkholderia caribensis]MCO4881107.1 hypothetical protein [Paraburkholderia caribensis]PTB27358.1 hypothetical protein C9I56_18570 [Paraburkholderia caribensis]QLB63689.1 hypothetical protein A9O66_15675 [Paraburkholderia caribensis]
MSADPSDNEPTDNEPTGSAARPPAAPTKSKRTFLGLLMSGIPPDVARDKFERLWDETNALAASSMMSAQGRPYIALLKRMHTAFVERYPR